MNTCDTCKWWEDFKLKRKPCGGCSNLKLSRYQVSPDGLCINNQDMDGQQPVTGPKFGCVHHEPKP